MGLINIIRKGINVFNIDVKTYPDKDLRRRQKLISHFKINKILDVGANMGQYAKLARKLGFKEEIVSFEPLSKAYKVLALESKNDIKWKIHNFGLGNKHEEIVINISDNLASSSIMDITSTHTENAPESIYKSKEKITVKRLDELEHDLIMDGDIILLKIDVQGFEKNVIEGASSILSKIKGIQIEMSLVELYEGEMLFFEMANLLKKHGFSLYSLQNGFFNKNTGQLLQVDGVFFRND